MEQRNNDKISKRIEYKLSVPRQYYSTLEEVRSKIWNNLSSSPNLLSEFLPHVEKYHDNLPHAKRMKKAKAKKLKILFSNEYSQVVEFVKKDGAKYRDRCISLRKHLDSQSEAGMYFALATFQLLQDRKRRESERCTIGHWFEELTTNKTAEEIITTVDLENTCAKVIKELLMLFFNFRHDKDGEEKEKEEEEEEENGDAVTATTNFVSESIAKINGELLLSRALTMSEIGLILLNCAMGDDLADIDLKETNPMEWYLRKTKKMHERSSDRYIYEQFSEYLFVPVYHRNGEEIAEKDKFGISFTKEVDYFHDKIKGLTLIALPADDDKFFKKMLISCIISNCALKCNKKYGILNFHPMERYILPCQLVSDYETGQIYAEFEMFDSRPPDHIWSTNAASHGYGNIMFFITACISLYARMLLYVNPNLSIEENTVMDLFAAQSCEMFILLPLPYRKEAVNEEEAISRINKTALRYIIDNHFHPSILQPSIDDFGEEIFEVDRFIDNEELVKKGAKLISQILEEGVVSSDKNFIFYNTKKQEEKEFFKRYTKDYNIFSKYNERFTHIKGPLQML